MKSPSASEIATVTKVYGLWIGLAGAAIGGIAVSRLGLMPTLLLGGIAAAASHLTLALLAARGHDYPMFVVSVCVLEAGGNHLNDPLVDTPAMFLQMFNKDEYDWKFMTTPQRGHMEQKEHHVVRGKMLGGSSGINCEFCH